MKMTNILYRTFIALIVINAVRCGPPSTQSIRIPPELSNALELLRPPDRTRFIAHCLHLVYMCSEQEVKHYVWSIQDLHQFQFNNFWNWYRCTKTGNPEDCPVNGGWSIWSKWGHCDITCGPGGLQSRFRKCNSPRPRNGGRKCDGQTTQVTRCKRNIACQLNGGSSMLSMVHENYLKKLHRSNPKLKKKCVESHCSYQEVQDIIVQNEEADKYWSYINCYKHSEGCPVDGGWSDWGEWSRCSSNCGNGHRYHLRYCDSPRPLNGGEMCSGSSLDKAKCFENNCTETVGLHFSPWSDWSQCSVSCDEGVRQSVRRCIGDGTCVLGDGTSRETIIKEQPCEMTSCQRSGGWSGWSEWSMCTAICGWGEHVHTRSCTNPIPFGPDSACVEEPFEDEKCSHTEASCNGTQPFKQREYSNWSRWTSCRVTCAGGTRLRHRACTDDGMNTPCTGPLYDVAACNGHIPCPVDGGWTDWTQWSTCSETCDSGFTERHRTCTSPRPAFGGAVCSGNSTERTNCQDGTCPDFTSSWGEWGNWTQCTVSCDGGTNTRQRSCLVKDDVVDMMRCGGEYRQLGACSLEACPINGDWANWNGWRPCSVACGEGITSRDRTCTNPAPIGNGNVCDGYGTESRHCYTQPCTTEHGGVMRRFGGNSFLMYKQLGQPTKQVLIYLRLLPKSSDGLILMKRHEINDHQLVYVSLSSGCVYLYAKMGSAELKVVGHPVKLFKWNTIQVSITGNLGHIRVNDEYTESGNFTEELSENLDYDLPLYLGGCMPHLYPEDERETTVWSGFVGKIAALRMNYKPMSLNGEDNNWQGRNRPYTSLNSGKDVMDIMATAIKFNGEQVSKIPLNAGEDLRDIQAVVSTEDSIGLLLFIHGSVPGSLISLRLAKKKLVLSLHLGNKEMDLERDLDEIEMWMIIDIKIDPNQVSLSVNKGPASQLAGPNVRFTPSDAVYVGGLPPWKGLRPESEEDGIFGFTGYVYSIKLNDAEYFMEDMFRQSEDKSVDSASATLANNFQEHYVIHKASVQLRCSHTMYGRGVQVVWLRENEVVDITADHIRFEEDNPLLPNTTILHLHSIDEERQGMYGCQFRFPNRAEIPQSFAVSLSEPHDILARTLMEWKMSVMMFFGAVLVALVITSFVTCITFMRRRPYYILKIMHTTLDSLGFGSKHRTTLADLRDIDETYDGQVDFKEEKRRLDQKDLELSRRSHFKDTAKRKIKEKKEFITNRVKKWTGQKGAGTRRVSSTGLRYTTRRYSDNDDVEGYTIHGASLQYVHSQEHLQLTSDVQPSVELMENDNNSGTSSRINREESQLSSLSLGATIANDASDASASKDLHQLQSMSQTHSSHSQGRTSADEYNTESVNEVDIEESVVLTSPVSPSEGILITHHDSSVTGEIPSGHHEATDRVDTQSSQSVHADTSDMADSEPNISPLVGINQHSVGMDNSYVRNRVRRQSDFFNNRALQLAGLLSSSGVTPPMTGPLTPLISSPLTPLVSSPLTPLVSSPLTPLVSSPVAQLEDAGSEDEYYEDTHE